MPIHIPGDIAFRDIADEAVVLNLSTGIYFGLDSVGTRIWHLLAEHGSNEPVVNALLAEYDVEEGRLRRDVEALIQQLLDKGLVARDEEHTPSAR
ncbi:MAG: PqqD family protein [Nitrospirota bacterium]